MDGDCGGWCLFAAVTTNNESGQRTESNEEPLARTWGFWLRDPIESAGRLVERQRERELPRSHLPAALFDRQPGLLPLLSESRSRLGNFAAASARDGAAAPATRRRAWCAALLQP